jgi:hypothetical protein
MATKIAITDAVVRAAAAKDARRLNVIWIAPGVRCGFPIKANCRNGNRLRTIPG